MAAPEPSEPVAVPGPEPNVGAAPVTVPGPDSMPPPPAPPKKTPWLAVVAIVVVVVAVVGVLAFSGVLNHGGSGANNVIAAGTPFSQNARSGESTATSTSGGPWTVIGAEGLNLSSSVSEPDFGVLGGGSGCTYTAVAGAPANVIFPATPSNATAGTAATWVFIAINPAGNTLFVVSAQGSTAAVAEGSTSCGAGFSGFESIVGASVVDSTTVAATANGDGGSAFLAAHPGATEIFTLVGTTELIGWDVEYSTCPFAASGGTGTSWELPLDAATGAALGSATTSTDATC